MNAPSNIPTEELRLYKSREPIFPKAIDGRFRRLKWWILGITLSIYYITPFLRWDRGPYLPDQAVLIDLKGRRFFFFMIEIWPQEFYYVAGLLIMAGLGLFLFTSALGRVWCGYACPQTVWVDLFMHVERLIDGDRNAQIRLYKAPWSLRKIGLRLIKYVLWLMIAWWTGGAWVLYFTDAPTLARELLLGTAPSVAYVTIGILTATTFVFGGFMREQVCIYMCPWPRIQGAMLDENSLVVSYKEHRGEPRGKHRKKEAGAALGDCIDCNACVAVCPMGIDIRDGQQLECITCALCIDACDEVMAKIGKPRGLIDYATVKDLALEKAGLPARPMLQTIIRPRTLVYFALWSAVGLSMLFVLALRARIDMNVLPVRNPLFVTLSSGDIRNSYEVKILNMNGEPRHFTLGLDGPAALEMWIGTEERRTRSHDVTVDADRLRNVRVFVAAPPKSLTEVRTPFRFVVRDQSNGETVVRETIFNAPK